MSNDQIIEITPVTFSTRPTDLLEQENARLRAALAEYAKTDNWLASTYDNTGELDGWWLWNDGPLAAGREPWQIAQDALKES